MLGFLKKTSCDTHEGPGDKDQYKDYNAALLSYFYALKYIPIDRSFKIATTNQWNDFCLSDTRGWFSILLQDSSSTCSHFVSKLRSRVGKTDVAAHSCYSKWRAEHCTLVQSVTEGHLGQFRLGPRVVQYLPAPLERAEDALLLQLSFGTHIEPRPQNTSHNLDHYVAFQQKLFLLLGRDQSCKHGVLHF